MSEPDRRTRRDTPAWPVLALAAATFALIAVRGYLQPALLAGRNEGIRNE
jgi:hypothetical protein